MVRCERLSPDALREAARACPALEALRVGGSAAAAVAAAAALPDVVPRVLPVRAVQESWEQLPDPDAVTCQARVLTTT